MEQVHSGILLISDPFLKDPNFRRTVVLLCEHETAGSIGFVLNKTMDITLQDIMDDATGLRIPVYEGGPVQKESLHFIHRQPSLISDGLEINDGIFWGGDFADVLMHLQSGQLTEQDIRLFIGYSGWGSGQLQSEMDEKCWITRTATQELVFHHQNHQIWKQALAELGGEYRQMVNYPIDPQLN